MKIKHIPYILVRACMFPLTPLLLIGVTAVIYAAHNGPAKTKSQETMDIIKSLSSDECVVTKTNTDISVICNKKL